MKRTKKHIKRSLGPGTPGPKSSCTEEVIQQTYRLCLLGLTNREIAQVFNKDKSTIEHWYREKPKFKAAMDEGRTLADSEVAEALFRKAKGYRHPSTKFYKDRVVEKEYDADGNVIAEKTYTRIIKQPYMKQYVPDTKAAVKILGSRHRQTWGEAYKVEHKHSHMHVGDVNIHHILEQISDEDMFTDEELKVASKLGLQRAAKEITSEN